MVAMSLVQARARASPAKVRVKFVLSDLPDRCFKQVANSNDGTQFYTRVIVGGKNVRAMLDSGSGVNSFTEDWLVGVLNTHRKLGVMVSDSRHPVKQLERWPEKEAVRGVAGGKLCHW